MIRNNFWVLDNRFMNKLKENIAVEYSAGLLKVLACAGDVLPIRVSYSFSFSLHEDGIKIFLWPVNHAVGITPSINIKFQGENGVIYECELVIKIDVNGYAEFILCPQGLEVVKFAHMITVDKKVDFVGNVEVMEKMYHYLYISNNALNLYTKLLKKDSVIAGLNRFEVQELRRLTGELDCSIQKNNIAEAMKILYLLSKWDFKLSCI